MFSHIAAISICAAIAARRFRHTIRTQTNHRSHFVWKSAADAEEPGKSALAPHHTARVLNAWRGDMTYDPNYPPEDQPQSTPGMGPAKYFSDADEPGDSENEDGPYCDECGEEVDSDLDLWEGLCEDCRPVEDDDLDAEDDEDCE
jgi:hypothetical protein